MPGRLIRTTLGAALLLAILTAPASAAATEVVTMVPAFSPFNVANRSATIKGLGFTASTTVSFGGTPAASVIFIDARTLVAVIPTVPSAQIATVTVSDPVNGSATFYPFLHTGPVIYVATTGNDNNAGTTPASPKRTVGAALAAADAVTPTEIRVAAGFYAEAQVDILNATALSCGWAPGFGLRDPDGSVTEINGGRTAFVLRTAGLMNMSVIDGCTIANGLRDGFGGGGLVISADTVVINNNVIAGNISSNVGGGVYWRASTSYGGAPTFSSNIIVGNRASNKHGGGIGVYQSYNTVEPVELTITSNQIVGNRASNGRGGGISFSTGTYAGYNNTVLRVTDNAIVQNQGRGGGGVDVTTNDYASLVDLRLRNNLITRNITSGSGGGIALGGLGTVTGHVTGSTLADNSSGAAQGGGMTVGGAVTLDPSYLASDLILWGNTGGDYLGIGIGDVAYSISGTPLGGPGHIASDPIFESGQLGDYYLRQNDPNAPDSPGVDAGSSTASDLSLGSLTTALDSTTDAGTNDLGYHFLTALPLSSAPVSVLRTDPPTGDIRGDDWTLVRGDGFDPGAEVRFDNVPATDSIYLGHRRILARPPAHAVGFVNVRVFNPDSSNATLVSGYLYVDNTPPTWESTVGVITAQGGLDSCDRSVLLDWNGAFDLDSPPVVFDIYREECIVSIIPGLPCQNFGYIPRPDVLVGTTTLTWFVDDTVPTSGQAKQWVYTVRARDSAAFFINREYNFGKRLATGSQGSTEAPPPGEIGDTLRWVPGDPDSFTWGTATGATWYGFYRTNDASTYSSIPTLPLLIELTPANNDGNGDGLTDTMYTDVVDPVPGEAFYYKVSALDKCGGESLQEILP